jgi:hypothetical protein
MWGIPLHEPDRIEHISHVTAWKQVTLLFSPRGRSLKMAASEMNILMSWGKLSGYIWYGAHDEVSFNRKCVFVKY